MLSCINLKQPWADAIVEGMLPILIRTFSVAKRGQVGIAATSRLDKQYKNMMCEEDIYFAEDRLLFDCVIGKVEITNCVKISREEAARTVQEYNDSPARLTYPSHYIPKTKVAYLWSFERPIRLEIPLEITKKNLTWSQTNCEPIKTKKPQKQSYWSNMDLSRYNDQNLKSYSRLQL